jgi:hypothetical protein
MISQETADEIYSAHVDYIYEGQRPFGIEKKALDNLLEANIQKVTNLDVIKAAVEFEDFPSPANFRMCQAVNLLWQRKKG